MVSLHQQLKSDLKIYFMFRKRELFNTFLNGDTASNYPTGKQRTGQFDALLKPIFYPFDKVIYQELLGNSMIRSNQTAVRYNKRNEPVYIHMNIGFAEFLRYINLHYSLRLQRLSKSYAMYEECKRVVDTSGHEDVVVKANIRYVRMLKAIFIRFHVNPKCIEKQEEKGLQLTLLME